MRFDVAEGAPDGGRGLTLSPTIGPYAYLVTGPGLQRTDRLFTVVKRMRRFGLSTWDNRGPVAVKTLTIEKVDGLERPVDFFLSFDVEALPFRADADHVNRLVWGQIDGEEYGIRRICRVLEQYGLRANFMIDYASCLREGDPPMRDVVEYLAGAGHEIHLHLHSEWLARFWGLESEHAIYLDTTSYEMSRRMLDYTMSKHVSSPGSGPACSAGRLPGQSRLRAGRRCARPGGADEHPQRHGRRPDPWGRPGRAGTLRLGQRRVRDPGGPVAGTAERVLREVPRSLRGGRAAQGDRADLQPGDALVVADAPERAGHPRRVRG